MRGNVARADEVAQRQLHPGVLGRLQEQAEVLAHQRQREPGRALLGEQRVREVAAEHVVAGRAGADRGGQRLELDARLHAGHQHLAERGRDDRGQHVVAELRDLSRADAADVHDVRGEVIEHRAARASSASASPPTITASVPFSAPTTPRLTGASRNPTPLPRRRSRQLAGHGRIAGAEVDDQRAGRARPRARCRRPRRGSTEFGRLQRMKSAPRAASAGESAAAGAAQRRAGPPPRVRVEDRHG